MLLPVDIDDAALKAEWLSRAARGAAGGGAQEEGRSLRSRSAAIAASWSSWRSKNAAASFATRRNARADTELALGKLQRRLKLPRLPRVIECYDISHLQGFATVASMVVFVDGRPEKSRYRTYKVRAPARGGDAARPTTTTSRRCTRCCRGASAARARPAEGDATRGSCPT